MGHVWGISVVHSDWSAEPAFRREGRKRSPEPDHRHADRAHVVRARRQSEYAALLSSRKLERRDEHEGFNAVDPGGDCRGYGDGETAAATWRRPEADDGRPPDSDHGGAGRACVGATGTGADHRSS